MRVRSLSALLCLISFAWSQDTDPEPTPARPTLIVYLGDSDIGVDPEIVKTIPRYQLSRFVRNALTKEYGDPTVEKLREDIRLIADIVIQDDPEIASLNHPMYSFSKWERQPAEIGGWCELNEMGVRDCVAFHDPVSLLRHLKYLCQLQQAELRSWPWSQVVGWSRDRVNEEYTRQAVRQGQLVDMQVTETIEIDEFGPLDLDPFPPIEYARAIRETHTETVKYVIGKEDYEEETRLRRYVNGDVSPLLLMSQMDQGSGFLIHRVRASVIERYGDVESGQTKLTAGKLYEIEFTNSRKTVGRFKQIDGPWLVFEDDHSTLRCNPYTSQTVVRRHTRGEDLYGIVGHFDTIKLIFRSIEEHYEPDTSKQPVDVGPLLEDESP